MTYLVNICMTCFSIYLTQLRGVPVFGAPWLAAPLTGGPRCGASPALSLLRIRKMIFCGFLYIELFAYAMPLDVGAILIMRNVPYVTKEKPSNIAFWNVPEWSKPGNTSLPLFANF